MLVLHVFSSAISGQSAQWRYLTGHRLGGSDSGQIATLNHHLSPAFAHFPHCHWLSWLSRPSDAEPSQLPLAASPYQHPLSLSLWYLNPVCSHSESRRAVHYLLQNTRCNKKQNTSRKRAARSVPVCPVRGEPRPLFVSSSDPFLASRTSLRLSRNIDSSNAPTSSPPQPHSCTRLLDRPRNFFLCCLLSSSAIGCDIIPLAIHLALALAVSILRV